MLSLRRLTEPRPLSDKAKCHVGVRRKWRRARGVGEEVVVRVNTALFIVRVHTAAAGFLQSDVHMMKVKNLVFICVQHVHLPWDTLWSTFPEVKNCSDCCSTVRQFIGGGVAQCSPLVWKSRERGGWGSHCLFFFFLHLNNTHVIQKSTILELVLYFMKGESRECRNKQPECPSWPTLSREQGVWHEGFPHKSPRVRLWKGALVCCYHITDCQNPSLVVGLSDKNQGTHVCPAARQIKTADVRNHL